MNEIFKSITKVILLIMILTLCLVYIIATIKAVLAGQTVDIPFKEVMLLVAGFFFAYKGDGSNLMQGSNKLKSKQIMRVKEAWHYSFVSLTSNFKIKAITSAVCGYLFSLIGYDMVVIEVIAYLVLIDWIFGTANALKRKKFTSWKFSKVFYKFFFYLLLLIMAHQSQRLSLMPGWFDDIVEWFIAITEIKSILENSALLGFKAAKKIEEKINDILEDKFN